MNAGRADTHLDLGDLIAEVTGQAVDDRAREHLARCEHCRAEANRWDLVAGGVRRLAAATPEPAQPARPGGLRHTRPRGLAGLRGRAVLAAGLAAALVLLAAAGYGASRFVHITFGTGGTGAETVLTAVNGCAGLEQAAGTLEQVNGTSLVVKTASGQPVTVTTTASTFVSMSGALRRDITDGASVTVRGTRSGGTTEAVIVTVGSPSSAVTSTNFVPVRGTVSDASPAGFTLVTSAGTRVPVTTSADTLVVVPHASLGQLQHGATVFAVGHAGPDGTLSARAVAAVTQLPPGVPAGLHGPAHVHLHISVHVSARGHVHGCSPSAIATALALGG
jgi:Domain of unknown function (DUF5666)